MTFTTFFIVTDRPSIPVSVSLWPPASYAGRRPFCFIAVV